jgi:hypothetical protein
LIRPLVAGFDRPLTAFFHNQFEKARGLAPFTFEAYPAGGVGENEIYKALSERVFKEARERAPNAGNREA